MDSAKLILTEPISPPVLLEHLNRSPIHEKIAKRESDKIDGISKQKKEQIAKDFESVLLSKLLDEMKNTIGDWGFDEDGASKQIQGIFWLYLSRHLANSGGLGLWKDIYRTLTNPDQTNKTTQSLDGNV